MHRDLKPHNILMTGAGNIKVVSCFKSRLILAMPSPLTRKKKILSPSKLLAKLETQKARKKKMKRRMQMMRGWTSTTARRLCESSWSKRS